MHKFLYILSIGFSFLCYGQGRKNFIAISDAEYEKIVFIEKSSYQALSKEGFRFSERSDTCKEQFIGKTIYDLEKEFPNSIKIQGTDSISLKGVNRVIEIVNNYHSDREYKEFKLKGVFCGNLLVSVELYEGWYTVLLNLALNKVFKLPNKPYFLNENKVFVFNHYYGEDEFSFLNIKNEASLSFSLNNGVIKDYFIVDKIIYFNSFQEYDKKNYYFKMSIPGL